MVLYVHVVVKGEFPMSMGDIIRRLRIEKGMTQEELGAVLGVQKSAIRKYESGMVENIPRSSIHKMAVLFNVRPSYLMGFSEEEQQTATPQISKEAAALIETLSNLPSEKADFANRVLELVNLMLQVPAERFPLLEDLLRVCLKNL
jgi:transcriptional regulator with XRE-family HTH domain